MIDEELVDLDGPTGRCSSTAAIGVARSLAFRREPGARLYRIEASEGVGADATATRWEAAFDLPNRMSVLDVVVTFIWDEARAAYGTGVASIAERPFPAAGSELERMLVMRMLSRRRLKGIWRQHLADRPHLPEAIPDAVDALVALRERGHQTRGLRRMVAAGHRQGGPWWAITDEQGEHRVRWTGDGERLRMVI